MGRRSSALGHAIDRELAARRRAPDDGRRADLRLASTIRTAPSGTPRRWARQAPPRRASSITGCASAMRRAGLAHFGQGKWYPGEQLPRWSLNCFWRKDGEPIWSERRADRRRDASTTASRPPTAQRFLRAGRRSAWGLDAGHVFCRPTRTPSTTCGASAGCRSTSIRSTRSLEDPQERARLARVFEQGLERAVGLRAAGRRATAAGTRWQSGPWFLRGERCYLIPGDSPLGYRLPLDSLPWVKPRRLSVRPCRPIRLQVFPPLPLRSDRADIPRRASAPRAAPRRDAAVAPARGAARPCRASCTRAARIAPTGSRAPRCAPSRATACCMCSCRRREHAGGLPGAGRGGRERRPRRSASR